MLGARGLSRSWRWALLLPLACCISCSKGPTLNPVQGTVLYKDQPLKGVLVSFHPEVEDLKAHVPLGLTREDGTFIVTTGEEQGAPAGKYTLTFLCSEAVTPANEKAALMGPQSEDRFKGAYLEKAKSTFKVEVKAGSNQLEPLRLK